MCEWLASCSARHRHIRQNQHLHSFKNTKSLCLESLVKYVAATPCTRVFY